MNAGIDEEPADDAENQAARGQSEGADWRQGGQLSLVQRQAALVALPQTFPYLARAGADDGRADRADEIAPIGLGHQPGGQALVAAAAETLSDHQRHGVEGERQVRERADQQPAPDHQSLCVRAVIVGVERTLDEAPAGMAEQADRQDHDYDGPERLRQQLFQRALGVGGLAARPDRGEYG